jgi:hypothetical protein
MLCQKNENFALVDFEYDKTFLKSIVSDFFHFVLSVFIVGENQFWEEKISLKVHHKVAGGIESSKNRKIALCKKNLRVIIIWQVVSVFRIRVAFPGDVFLKILKFDPRVSQEV